MYNQATTLSGGIGSFWEQLVSWYQNSFINDILSYIIERYYSVELEAYEYFSFGPGANQTIQTLILSLAIGFIIAAIVIAHTKKKFGGFVGKLLLSGCHSPETAKTLYELGYFRNATIRKELSRGVVLKKLVYKVESDTKKSEDLTDADGQDSGETKNKLATKLSFLAQWNQNLDFTKLRFYIPEDLKYRAEIRFERKGSGWIPVLLTAIGSLIGASLICRFLPGFIGMLDNLIMLTAPN